MTIRSIFLLGRIQGRPTKNLVRVLKCDETGIKPKESPRGRLKVNWHKNFTNFYVFEHSLAHFVFLGLYSVLFCHFHAYRPCPQLPLSFRVAFKRSISDYDWIWDTCKSLTTLQILFLWPSTHNYVHGGVWILNEIHIFVSFESCLSPDERGFARRVGTSFIPPPPSFRAPRPCPSFFTSDISQRGKKKA